MADERSKVFGKIPKGVVATLKQLEASVSGIMGFQRANGKKDFLLFVCFLRGEELTLKPWMKTRSSVLRILAG